MSLLLTSGRRFADLPLDEYEGKRYLHEGIGCVITVVNVDLVNKMCELSFGNGNEPTGGTPLFLLTHLKYLADT